MCTCACMPPSPLFLSFLCVCCRCTVVATARLQLASCGRLFFFCHPVSSGCRSGRPCSNGLSPRCGRMDHARRPVTVCTSHRTVHSMGCELQRSDSVTTTPHISRARDRAHSSQRQTGSGRRMSRRNESTARRNRTHAHRQRNAPQATDSETRAYKCRSTTPLRLTAHRTPTHGQTAEELN